MSRAAILTGLGTYLPDAILTNDMLAQVLDSSDAWIRSRTGVQQRHIAAEQQTTGDMAIQAGHRAMRSAGVAGVDAVVLATTTPDYACPATAPLVAARLDMAGTPAFDISAACSGFLYGLTTASALITAGIFETVLLIGADTFTQTLDPGDRTTRPLFGDGAGAVVLRAGDHDEPGALCAFDLGSDGNQVDLLRVPAVLRQERATGVTNGYFQMNGKAVFDQAVTNMAGSIQNVVRDVGWKIEDIDCVVPHQANIRILAALAGQLDVPFERVVTNVAEVGNTVAASIPLALAHGMRQGLLKAGDKVVLTGFGAGLTWGSVAMRWPVLIDIDA